MIARAVYSAAAAHARWNRQAGDRRCTAPLGEVLGGVPPVVGAVLAEQHDEWTEGRRYLGFDVLAKRRLTITDGHDATEE